MPEFIRVGKRRISTDAVQAVVEEDDGSVIVHYVRGGVDHLSGDDGAVFLEWADAHLLAAQNKKQQQQAQQQHAQQQQQQHAAKHPEEKKRP